MIQLAKVLLAQDIAHRPLTCGDWQPLSYWGRYMVGFGGFQSSWRSSPWTGFAWRAGLAPSEQTESTGADLDGISTGNPGSTGTGRPRLTTRSKRYSRASIPAVETYVSLVEGVSDATGVEHDGEDGPSGGIKNYRIWTVVRLALS